MVSAPGKIFFLLHAHLPFVREPDVPRFFEENWLFEAISETYLPLVQMLRRTQEKGVPGTLNLSVSPPLIEMLSDDLLIQKFSKHLYKQLELIEKEVKRFPDGQMNVLAAFYLERQKALIDTWENRCQKNLLQEFSALEKAKKINILTCVGTHPFLPAYESDLDAVERQLDYTVRTFKRAFHRDSVGVWLPECGYFKGVEPLLKKYGFRYFFLETHGILLANPTPEYGVFTSVKTPVGLFCMGRDQASSMEVWSRRTGFPGHPEYREFFKDIAGERKRDYLTEYFYSGNTPIDTGLKYYRITGKESKELYRPWNAMRLASEHAKIFIANREATFMDLLPKMNGNKAYILCPYDAELFGHWWFEGPLFLEAMMEFAASKSVLQLASADEILDFQTESVHEVAFSSWGEGGFSSVWINPETEKYYPMSYQIGQKLKYLNSEKKTPLLKRVIRQMERELLLFQASDWAFMIHNHSAADYARKRLDTHYKNALQLFDLWSKKQKKALLPLLESLEKKNNIFSE